MKRFCHIEDLSAALFVIFLGLAGLAILAAFAAYLALQPHLVSCRARHEADHVEFQIMPSRARELRRSNDFLRSCSA